MTDARDEIAEEKSPMAQVIKPIVDFLNTGLGYMQPFPESRMNEADADSSADHVAARDATHASEQRSEPRPERIQSSSENKISAQDEQRLVGDGESHDTKYQETEKGEPAVVCDPVLQLRG